MCLYAPCRRCTPAWVTVHEGNMHAASSGRARLRQAQDALLLRLLQRGQLHVVSPLHLLHPPQHVRGIADLSRYGACPRRWGAVSHRAARGLCGECTWRSCGHRPANQRSAVCEAVIHTQKHRQGTQWRPRRGSRSGPARRVSAELPRRFSRRWVLHAWAFSWVCGSRGAAAVRDAAQARFPRPP